MLRCRNTNPFRQPEHDGSKEGFGGSEERPSASLRQPWPGGVGGAIGRRPVVCCVEARRGLGIRVGRRQGPPEQGPGPQGEAAGPGGPAGVDRAVPRLIRPGRWSSLIGPEFGRCQGPIIRQVGLFFCRTFANTPFALLPGLTASPSHQYPAYAYNRCSGHGMP
jgi:hypothetical protein